MGFKKSIALLAVLAFTGHSKHHVFQPFSNDVQPRQSLPSLDQPSLDSRHIRAPRFPNFWNRGNIQEPEQEDNTLSPPHADPSSHRFPLRRGGSSGNVVIGNGNFVQGNQNTLQGNQNYMRGSMNRLFGNRARLVGDRIRAQGDELIIPQEDGSSDAQRKTDNQRIPDAEQRPDAVVRMTEQPEIKKLVTPVVVPSPGSYSNVVIGNNVSVRGNGNQVIGNNDNLQGNNNLMKGSQNNFKGNNSAIVGNNINTTGNGVVVSSEPQQAVQSIPNN